MLPGMVKHARATVNIFACVHLDTGKIILPSSSTPLFFSSSFIVIQVFVQLLLLFLRLQILQPEAAGLLFFLFLFFYFFFLRINEQQVYCCDLRQMITQRRKGRGGKPDKAIQDRMNRMSSRISKMETRDNCTFTLSTLGWLICLPSF